MSAARRRDGFVDVPVTYGAIGATQASDLLYYPPKGYKPSERSVRLGSGAERYETSRTALMSWGVQRGAGLEVNDIDPGTGEQYAGVRFNEDGSPAGMRRLGGAETVYDENGDPLIANGMTAVLRAKVGPFHIDAPVRIVYVIDDVNRAGFAYGTLSGHPASGEEAFLLERREDDSVWFTVRSFSKPASALYALLAPISGAVMKSTTTRFLRSLHPVAAA